MTLSDKWLLGEISKNLPYVHAAALYGSVARGDVEVHSDIDLLMICDSGRKTALLPIAEQSLSAKFARLSLALYSPAELKFLESARSLFLLHLKLESIVLFDQKGLLTSLLSKFQPKQSYSGDFVESLGLLDPLRTRVGSSPNDFHRLSYIYSLFRVFGVYLLAERQIYEFSKSKMTASLHQEYPHARDAVAALSKLRVLNANFFSGASIDDSSVSAGRDNSLSVLISALSELVGRPILLATRPYGEAIEEFAQAAAGAKVLNYRLRMWFLLLVYDGLNLYFCSKGNSEITSFAPEPLQRLTHQPWPAAVSNAMTNVLDHIRNYHLKYFLDEDWKIVGERATHTLQALAEEIPSSYS
jgi:predicted nucleotidyltransferase